jgi:hypothetical protein
MAWDRYAYTFNNPVKYSDPDGHFPFIAVIGTVLTWFGVIPDYRGVATAEQHIPQGNDIRGVDATVVAAGIAVQSQWYGEYKDSRDTAPNGGNSGLGIAQVSDPQMEHYNEKYGLEGDQQDPSVAVQAMALRIKEVQAACSGCNGRDMLVAAGLAQNGPGFSAATMGFLSNPKNGFVGEGGINWSKYFDGLDSKSNPLLNLRAVGNHNFDTRFMLNLFVNDLRELYNRGWTLPYGVTEDDLDYIEDL